MISGHLYKVVLTVSYHDVTMQIVVHDQLCDDIADQARLALQTAADAGRTWIPANGEDKIASATVKSVEYVGVIYIDKDVIAHA